MDQWRQIDGMAKSSPMTKESSGISRYLNFRHYWVWHLSGLCFFISLFEPFFLSCIPFIIFLRVLPTNGVFDYGALLGVFIFFALSLAFHFRVLEVFPTPVKKHDVFLFNQYVAGSVIITALFAPYLVGLIINETFRFFSKSEIVKSYPYFSIFSIYKNIKEGSNLKGFLISFLAWGMCVMSAYATFSKPIESRFYPFLRLFTFRDGLDEERNALLILTFSFMGALCLMKGTWIPFLKNITNFINFLENRMHDKEK